MAADPCSRAGCDRLLAFRRLRRSAEDIIEIGRDLLAVKASLPHGSFLPWIEAEFGMSQRAAYNFMKVAESYGAKLATIATLPPTALYALASAEPDVQARVEEMLASGEVVSKATVDEQKRQATVRALFEYVEKAGFLDQLDAFNDVTDMLAGIVERARARIPNRENDGTVAAVLN